MMKQDITANIFKAGGNLFENHARYGCSDKDCVKHMFMTTCMQCNADGAKDSEIRTCSLRVASANYGEHVKCALNAGFGQYRCVGGFHYCRVWKDGKWKMRFPKDECYY
jgi:hypothetical protein